MWNKVLLIILSVFLTPLFLCAQEKIKHKKENYLHFKIGGVANFTNKELIKSLNGSAEDVFTSNKSICYNPAVDVEFEHRFSRYIGLNIDFGFLQTRQGYHYLNLSSNYEQNGFIISSIPHINISPSFFINNTTLYAGIGYYKYYYSFKPVQLGNGVFDQNAEGYAIYSNIGVSQAFDIKTRRFSVGVNYFGLARTFDSGVQLSVGMAL